MLIPVPWQDRSDRKNANLNTALCLKECVAEMRTFWGRSIRAPGLPGLHDKAGYKTAASTSLRHHIKISLANRAVSI